MKTADSLEELDAMIAQEKHNVAEEYLLEGWMEAAGEAIEPEIIARSAMIVTLKRLIAECGEAKAREIAAEIPQLFENGKLLDRLQLN